MMLKLAGEIEFVQCSRCRGVGSIKLEDTYGTRSNQWVRNGRVPSRRAGARRSGYWTGSRTCPRRDRAMDEDREDQEQEYQPDCWRCGSSVDVETCEGCGMSFCRRCWKTHDEDKCKEGDDAHDHE